MRPVSWRTGTSLGPPAPERTTLAAFAAAYPDVSLEITTTAEQIDIVSAGFDAGIQLGEYVERDMIAVRVSPDQRAAIVGSPAYFARHPAPRTPRELTKHQCVNFRRGALGLYRWEFERDGRALSVAVRGALTVDSADLLVRAAIDGAGLILARWRDPAPRAAITTRSRANHCREPPRPHMPTDVAEIFSSAEAGSAGASDGRAQHGRRRFRRS